MSGQTPEFRDVIGGRDAHIEQKVAGHADVLVGRPSRERRAVRHSGDGVGLDHALARWITPDLARISVYPLGRSRREVETVHVGPLLDDLVGVLRLHHRIGPPCHTDTRGHGPLCGDAARTRSPHSRADRSRTSNMLSNASFTLVAV
jgi:hypothetical protein